MYWTIPERPLGAWLVIGLLMIVSPFAATADDDGAVNLTADQAEVRDMEGLSVYRGNVVLTRGDMRITGDLMRVYSDAQRRLDRVEVDGTPATWQQSLPGEVPREAEAPRMEYYATGPERILLLGGGRLWQGEATVTGEVVTHFPEEDRTVAERGEQDDDRVRATFFPDRQDDS